MAPAERQSITTLLSMVTLVELPLSVRNEAAHLRGITGLKLPDAIIAATALTLGAELLSNDRQMTRVPGLVVTALAVKP